MADLPLHIAVLDAIATKVEERRTEWLEKIGKGVQQEEYLRGVGRIAEAKATLEHIQEMRNRLLTEDADELEEIESEQRRERHRAQRRPRRT